MTSLPISECFYSIQGEGPSIGSPSIFLRLKSCNLTCGGLKTVQTKELDSGATWRCDTIETWIKGTDYTIQDILDEWAENGYIKALETGAHLVLTGGEPLLHSESLEVFLDALKTIVGDDLYVECETNGTIDVSANLLSQIQQFNVSPKLSNSGMPAKRRIVSNVLQKLATLNHVFFKFVISSSDDLDELLRDYVDSFQIPHHHIYLMPAADTRESLIQNSPKIIDFCKTYGFKFSNRLHLMVWNQKTGV